MERLRIAERPDWRAIAEREGFDFHTIDNAPYWVEDACYAFTLRQIEDDIEDPSTELDGMCREIAARACKDGAILRRLRIPETVWDAIAESWHRDDPTLYGRFDLAYTGKGPAKLLEYNADTPTGLYETGWFQWAWMEDAMARGIIPAGSDQFNSVHDKLIAAFAEIAGTRPLHLTCMPDSPEDRGTVAYLEDCAVQAGLATKFVPLSEIGLADDGTFADAEGGPMELVFKLYPWEWIFADEYGTAIRGSSTRFIEPPWKAVLSSKGLLPLLWESYPGHPNLLPAFFEDDPRKLDLGTSFARKPLWSREGANVTLVKDAKVIDTDDGPYGGEGYIRQGLADIAVNEGRFAVIGSWIVAGQAAGMCIREDASAITKNTSCFLPHIIRS